MNDELAFPYEDLWYIKLISKTDKNPLEKWGGYSQDFEAAENVYSHEELVESDHEWWGIVGIKDGERASRSLLIFDLDVHKAPEDFDADRVGVPNETSLVKSQSGGFHVPFVVTNAERGEGKESDFQMTSDPGWDIDIRGSFVKHHVVAPADIPGVGGKYELVTDAGIRGVLDPRDAASRITLDGEPLLEYDPAGGLSGGSIEIDRNADPPEEMPTCYHRGLQVRAANPDDPNVNTHQVNTLTALCGLAAGYEIDTMVGHFCEDFAPGENADTGETRYQLETMARKMDRDNEPLAPPAVSTLREYGILDEDETCDCDIEYHGDRSAPRFDAVEAAADGGTDAINTGGGRPEQTLQEQVRDILWQYGEFDDITQKTVVHRAALAITEHRNFVYPREAIGDWRSVLHRYDPETGIYRPDGEEELAELCERLLGDFLTNSQMNELQGKVERLSHAREGDLETEPNRLVVSNGILDLHTGNLQPHAPEEYHRTRIDVEYHEDAECPHIDEFFHDIVEDKDVDTLYRLAAHTLYGEYIDEKAAMLVGDGQNGKSVFLDLLEHFIGGENVSHLSLQALSNSQFGANNLHTRYANFHPDMSDEKIKDLGTFKKLTGRDTMQADVKYEKPITFENYATLIFAANTMPQMEEDTHALWRRWIYINFPNTFDDSNPDTVPKRVLMRQLTQESELEGLLARCVEELGEWWDGRDLFAGVMSPDQVREKMKRASEPVYAFASSCLVEDEDGALPKQQVREAYREFAREEDLPTMDDGRFGEKILNIRDYPIETGQKRMDGTRSRVYTGVSWSSRGRQIAGLDEPNDEQQGDLEDGGPAGRAETLLDIMRNDFNGEEEPVRRPMLLGRSMTTMGSQGKHAFEDLKDAGRIYQPADREHDDAWMIK